MKTTICDLCGKPIDFDSKSGNWKLKFRQNISTWEAISKGVLTIKPCWIKSDICANCKKEIIKYLKEKESAANENQ